jgi:diphthine synthase
LLVGLGLDVGDFTVKAFEDLKNADLVYYEDYTSPIDSGVIDYIRKLLPGKKIERLERSDLEEKAMERLIIPAKSRKVAVLVSGDPFSATTHTSVFLDALRENVECRIHHAPSILTVVSECGLQLYKFGRTVTLPAGMDCPKSVYDFIVRNHDNGLHTLVLLDVGMPVSAALRSLIEADRKGSLLGDVVVLARAGTLTQKLFFGSLGELIKKYGDDDFGPPPHCIAVLGDLHFFEREFLEEVSKKR